MTNAALGAVVQPTGIAAFGTADPAEKVKPADNTAHDSYVFYTKITSSDGGSTGYFGPYTLWVGCTSSTVSFTDSLTLIDTTNIPVGDTTLLLLGPALGYRTGKHSTVSLRQGCWSYQ